MMAEAVITATQPDDASEPLPLAAAIRRQTPPADLLEYALVDAFTSKAFEGNPAAVVLLPQAKDERWMQQVAAEFNISQTAFLVRKESRAEEGKLDKVDNVPLQESENGHLEKSMDTEYHIRWFTPTFEVPICGHATLASSHLLFTAGLVSGDTIVFHSKSGKLAVRKVEPVTAQQENGVLHRGGKMSTHLLELNFPMIRTTACDKSEIKSLSTTFRGVEVIFVGKTGSDALLVELSSIEEVQNLHPQWDELVQCSGIGLHVTAKDSSQSNIDFMSRTFFPKLGINEDPVCGSAHCALTPYWAAKLGKDSLEAYQASKRGGRLSLRVDLQGSRVYIRGEATTVMTGVILK